MKNTASFTSNTKIGTLNIQLTKDANQNSAEIRKAEINGVSVNFERFTYNEDQTNAGILINLKQLSKAVKANCVDKEVILLFEGCKDLKSIYTQFCTKKIEYTGKIIDSGYGFYMKDTESNWAKCHKYGYDAIEMTN